MEETNRIIYEISLEVQKEKKDGYLKFLDSFVEEMLTLEGFMSAKVGRRSEMPTLFPSLCDLSLRTAVA